MGPDRPHNRPVGKPVLFRLLGRVGSQLPPQVREEVFEPNFEDNYREILAISRLLRRRGWRSQIIIKPYTHALMVFWTYMLLRQCLQDPYRAVERLRRTRRR